MYDASPRSPVSSSFTPRPGSSATARRPLSLFVDLCRRPPPRQVRLRPALFVPTGCGFLLRASTRAGLSVRVDQRAAEARMKCYHGLMGGVKGYNTPVSCPVSPPPPPRRSPSDIPRGASRGETIPNPSFPGGLEKVIRRSIRDDVSRLGLADVPEAYRDRCGRASHPSTGKRWVPEAQGPGSREEIERGERHDSLFDRKRDVGPLAHVHRAMWGEQFVTIRGRGTVRKHHPPRDILPRQVVAPRRA